MVEKGALCLRTVSNEPRVQQGSDPTSANTSATLSNGVRKAKGKKEVNTDAMGVTVMRGKGTEKTAWERANTTQYRPHPTQLLPLRGRHPLQINRQTSDIGEGLTALWIGERPWEEAQQESVKNERIR
jgi:hypothetical protein